MARNRPRVQPAISARTVFSPDRLTEIMRNHCGLVVMPYAHNSGCPAALSQRTEDCTCDPDVALTAPFGLTRRT